MKKLREMMPDSSTVGAAGSGLCAHWLWGSLLPGISFVRELWLTLLLLGVVMGLIVSMED